MLVMLSLVFAEYHNIVKIDNDKFANDVLQHIIHDVLECAWCICETKAQHSELK